MITSSLHFLLYWVDFMTVINSFSQQKHVYITRDTIQTLHTTRETIQIYNKKDNYI